jgi:hypothetical protein
MSPLLLLLLLLLPLLLLLDVLGIPVELLCSAVDDEATDVAVEELESMLSRTICDKMA